MIVDKDKLKEYINSTRSDVFHINDIIDIEINNMRYYREGYFDISMITTSWSGWKFARDKSIFVYRSNRLNRFNLESYQEWLVEVRNSKLELLNI